MQVLQPYWTLNGSALYHGDVRARLRQLPERSVHSVITSPPYWALRSYHNDAADKHLELGAEEVPDCLGWATGNKCGACYVCHMVEVFTEVYRVLRDDGTLWLNLGDSYTSGGRSTFRSEASDNKGHNVQNGLARADAGLPSGNLVGVPWRVALALQASGWVLRAAMPWIKRNAMPDSAENRPGRATEDVFLLTKGTDYYFDMESVKPAASGWPGGGSTFSKPGGGQHRTYERPDYKKRGWRSGDLWLSCEDDEGSGLEIAGFDVPVAKYGGAHYATFNPRLIAPMILAGTSGCGACAECGAPYQPVVVKQAAVREASDGEDRDRSIRSNRNGLDSTLNSHKGGAVSTVDAWRRGCNCKTTDIVPCTVLDPFVGSGTTVATAIQLGRRGVGIDLSEVYLRDNAVPRIESAISGVPVGKRSKYHVVPTDCDPPPPPKALRLK